ncbi:hypothetical protein D3C80_886930 [compost metagenome]
MRGQRHHKRLFAFVELAQLTLLNHQYAQQLAAMNDRHAEEGSEPILLHLGNIFEAGVALRVRQVNRLGTAPNQADDAFIKGQCDSAPTRFF